MWLVGTGEDQWGLVRVWLVGTSGDRWGLVWVWLVGTSGDRWELVGTVEDWWGPVGTSEDRWGLVQVQGWLWCTVLEVQSAHVLHLCSRVLWALFLRSARMDFISLVLA